MNTNIVMTDPVAQMALTNELDMYFDEDFLENPSQPIKINGKYYDTEDVTDPESWVPIIEHFKDYEVQPMNANIDVSEAQRARQHWRTAPDPEGLDSERDTLEVFLLRVIATGQLFTVSNIYDIEDEATLTFYL